LDAGHAPDTVRPAAREDLATPASWSSPISTRSAIEAMPMGCIAVADAMGVTDAGIFGDILCARMAKKGVAGLVTDGVMRDMHGVLGTGLPVWCQGTAAPASVAALTFINWQEPIGCGRRRRGGDPESDDRGSRRRCRRTGADRRMDHGGGERRRVLARPVSAER
jgi:hypothetical protein